MLKWCGRLLPGVFLAASAWAMTPAAAFAQGAFTTQAVNMRAGPDRGFPLVAWFPAGTPVNVIGCIDGWRWCDVVTRWERGWVYARFLSVTFRNQPTTILHNGAWLGLPLITFSVGPYWGSHYRGRPWYGRQGQWSTWSPPPPVVRPPPRPPGWRPPSQPSRPPTVRPPPRPPTQGPGMGPPPQRPNPPPGQGPGTGPPPLPPPPGQGPGMGPGQPPENISRPPRGS